MPSERWNRINELFLTAQDQEPEQRNTFLKEACGTDVFLLHEVESLLAAYHGAGDFIQAPAGKNALEFLLHREVQLVAGDRIGAYNIVREIGRGGMGAVYLATRADELFQKSVAIKLIKRGMDTDDVLRHFRNEQQILGNFDHPNIARLMDGGSTENGLPYFIMEYVEGQPIDRYCDRQSLSITLRLELFQQVCAAVSYAHRNLVVHRDIKPSNILVTAAGFPKLLDFGIAKILQSEAGERSTTTGIRLMTPEYASPEQAQGLPVTTLSDVYSLGVLLYELLTGHSPYRLQNRTAVEIVRTITETQPQLPSAVINSVESNPAERDPALSPESVSKTREGSPDRLRRRLRGDLDNIVLMAMRKESQRRYQSVDQLSEDIKRHLQGLPITARKDTFVYRTARFVDRNRVTVAITVLALLTIAFSGLMIRWRANKQARLFQEFGQEVTRIEATMRYAYLLPLHNIQQDKKQVVDRLAYIKERMQSMGSVAYGPGYYSLGRGYLSLHRYQDAYDNLILAWEKHQYQEPAAANALGFSLAMLYQEKLREAEQLYSKELLKQRKSELDKQYRLPAQRYIQQGTNASEAPEYVDALLAFLGKQYPEALNNAHVAAQKLSWHYESKKLQGDIFAAMGNDQSSVGNITTAADLHEKAKTAYLEAARKGQSDPQMYDALCSIQSSIQEIQMTQKGTSSEAIVEEGISYCKKALQADSTDINANLFASKIYRDWAYIQNIRGNDSSVPVEKSINFARDALKIDSESSLAHLALGNAYSTRANAELYRQRNPIPFLDLADASLEKASRKMPEDHQVLSLLGANSLKRAQHETFAGKDPRPTLEKAIRILRKAVELNPENSKFYAMLGTAHYWKGIHENVVGLDPRVSFEQSIHQSEKSLGINPNLIIAHIWDGLAYVALADAQIDRGLNPTQAFDGALGVYRKCLTLDPNNANALAGIGIVFWKKAHVLQQDGKDPTSNLESAREAFRKSLYSDDKTVMTYALFAEAELVAARDAISHRKSPEPFFKEADRILHAGFSVNRNSVDCLESLAALHLVRAEYLDSLGESAEREIRLGVKAADDALKSLTNNALVIAYRGKLFLLRAQSSSGPARKKAALEAEASFDRAFKVKNILRKEYESDWEEAKRLGQD